MVRFKGELLDDVVATRSGIAESDQGRSFRAFYELLLTAERQDELTDLLDRLHRLEDLPDLDQRLARVHHDWIDASERTQRTVRQLSEQLRRFLDDQVWLENRRCSTCSARSGQRRDAARTRLRARDDHRRCVAADRRAAHGAALYRRTAPKPSTEVLSTAPTTRCSTPRCSTSSTSTVRPSSAVHRTLGAGRSVSLDDVLVDSPLEHGLAEPSPTSPARVPARALDFDDTERSQVAWVDDDEHVERRADLPL